MAEPWRIGTRIPINVYEGDRPICQCHSVVDAKQIVDAVNANVIALFNQSVKAAHDTALNKCLGLIRDIKSGKGVRIPGVLQPAEDLTRLQVAIESLKIADS